MVWSSALRKRPSRMAKRIWWRRRSRARPGRGCPPSSGADLPGVGVEGTGGLGLGVEAVSLDRRADDAHGSQAGALLVGSHGVEEACHLPLVEELVLLGDGAPGIGQANADDAPGGAVVEAFDEPALLPPRHQAGGAGEWGGEGLRG